MGDLDRRSGRRERRPRSNVESLITGLVVGSGFVTYWVFGGHQSWALFAAFFGGLLPAARGLAGLIAAKGAAPAAKRLGERETAAENERIALLVARKKGGRITPALVVLDSEMSVEAAERALDGLARKGHAAVRIRDDGRIEYEFSEFLPPPQGD
jgi:hypothetical protein